MWLISRSPYMYMYVHTFFGHVILAGVVERDHIEPLLLACCVVCWLVWHRVEQSVG